jgi:glycosyltransferase involved in cell wall biosynthesis
VDEPLVRTQVLPYLRGLAARGYAMHILTFEPRPHDDASRARVERELGAVGVTWHSLAYHRRPSLPATLFDIAAGAWTVRRLARRHRVRFLHGRSHVGAAIAWLAGLPFVFDVRGLLPDEYADAGHWRRGGIKYRLGKAMERVLLRRARQVVVLTDTLRDDLLRAQPPPTGGLTVIPCCADLAVFDPDRFDRARERASRGWDGRRVLTMVGKLGQWHLDAEVARVFAAARRRDPRAFLQVLTPGPADVLRRALAEEGVHPDAFDVRAVAPHEVPCWLAAADAGLSLVLPAPSKRSSSPTKVGEYLGSGLPVVSTSGIGDCDRLLAGGRGVLLPALDAAAYAEGVAALSRLLDDPQTAARCRAFAEAELSLETVGHPRYASVYERMP